MLTSGERVQHHAYGTGTVLRRIAINSGVIVKVKWDRPELGRFPNDKKPFEFESFCVDEASLTLLGE